MLLLENFEIITSLKTESQLMPVAKNAKMLRDDNFRIWCQLSRSVSAQTVNQMELVVPTIKIHAFPGKKKDSVSVWLGGQFTQTCNLSIIKVCMMFLYL